MVDGFQNKKETTTKLLLIAIVFLTIINTDIQYWQFKASVFTVIDESVQKIPYCKIV